MRHMTALIVLPAIVLLATFAMAADNTKCPISGRDVKPDVTMDMHGTTIAFCCGGCRSQFQKLSHAEQHEKFDAVASPVKKPTPGKPASAAEEVKLTSYYLLPNCPISGQPVASMDDPTAKMIDGRQVMFCCPPCIETFEADLPKYNARINEQIIKRQLPGYPLQNCLASGRPIDVKGTPTNAVQGNQLMRFCCGGCASYIQKDPARLKVALAKLDEAYVKQQLAKYPLETCIISGEPLGDKPVNVVVGGRLVRLCCAHCEKKFNKNPRAYMGKLDVAVKTANAEN